MINYCGKLLLAKPSLVDPNFSQTVVLLLGGNNDEGAFGFVLNRPSSQNIKTLWESLVQKPCSFEENIFLGGPVEGPLTALHRARAFGDSEILPDLFLTSSKDQLEKLVEKQVDPIRFFVGGSGWGGGQLANEIKEGTWFVGQAISSVVFADPSGLWRFLLELFGQTLLSEMLPLTQFPDKPNLN